jgi:hypothetical protein
VLRSHLMSIARARTTSVLLFKMPALSDQLTSPLASVQISTSDCSQSVAKSLWRCLAACVPFKTRLSSENLRATGLLKSSPQNRYARLCTSYSRINLRRVICKDAAF